MSSKSLLLLKNETNLWTRYTFEFTVRKLSITVRPWDRGQNCESHGKTVRLGRSVSRLKKNEKWKNNNNATVQRREVRPYLLIDEFLLKMKDLVWWLEYVWLEGWFLERWSLQLVLDLSRQFVHQNWRTLNVTLYWRKVWQWVYWNQWSGVRGKEQPVRSSQASSFYLSRSLHSKDAFRRLFKNMKYIESKEFILSLDQTFLSHVSTGKYIFNPKEKKCLLKV